MMRDLIRGAAAGAVGTTVLNLATYTDVAVRGRPPSPVPEETVAKVTEKIGVDLAREGRSSETATHRRTGLGAAFGYATGIGMGAAYGVLRPHLRRLPLAVVGLTLGAVVMAATSAASSAVGATDPRTWGTEDWLADIVPHALYGLSTAIAFDHRMRAAF